MGRLEKSSMPNPPKVESSESRGTLVTVSGAVKTFGLIVTMMSAVISVVWCIAGLRSQIDVLNQQQIALRHDLEMRELESDKRVTKIEERQDKEEKAVEDINRKLDVVETILLRIDKRVGGQ